MLVFISGSINSGKTSTSKALAKRLGADLINVDDLNDTIPNFNLATDLDKSMDLAIGAINKSLAAGKDVVANYVVRQRDFDRFKSEIQTKEQFVITLAPRIEVAQRNRGDRTLTDWEMQRIQYHYDTDIASPKFGHIIDNSDISIDETVDKILEIIDRQSPDLYDSFEYAGKTIRVEWFDVDAVENLPNVKWQQVYAIAKLDGKVPVVLYEDDHVNLPGGKTELGETIEETLHRELLEELNCRVLNWSPVGYQKLIEPGVPEPIYQLRVYAELEKVGEFTNDIGGEVIGYKLIDIKDLNSEIQHGAVGERMMHLAASKFS